MFRMFRMFACLPPAPRRPSRSMGRAGVSSPFRADATNRGGRRFFAPPRFADGTMQRQRSQHRRASFENAHYIVRALRNAASGSRTHLVEMVCYNAPAVLDSYSKLREGFPNLRCVCEDLMHVALKLEEAPDERPTVLSRPARRCFAKTAHGRFRTRQILRSSPGAVLVYNPSSNRE